VLVAVGMRLLAQGFICRNEISLTTSIRERFSNSVAKGSIVTRTTLEVAATAISTSTEFGVVSI
jgi:hypothetical protein